MVLRSGMPGRHLFDHGFKDSGSVEDMKSARKLNKNVVDLHVQELLNLSPLTVILLLDDNECDLYKRTLKMPLHEYYESKDITVRRFPVPHGGKPSPQQRAEIAAMFEEFLGTGHKLLMQCADGGNRSGAVILQLTSLFTQL